MKIYIVEWFSAEQYTDYSGPLKAFDSKEKAQQFIDAHQKGPYCVVNEDYDEGYYVSQRITELEIE